MEDKEVQQAQKDRNGKRKRGGERPDTLADSDMEDDGDNEDQYPI
jgi:hypothetical protein